MSSTNQPLEMALPPQPPTQPQYFTTDHSLEQLMQEYNPSTDFDDILGVEVQVDQGTVEEPGMNQDTVIEPDVTKGTVVEPGINEDGVVVSEVNQGILGGHKYHTIWYDMRTRVDQIKRRTYHNIVQFVMKCMV